MEVTENVSLSAGEMNNYVFAMDIGTRSIIGMVGCQTEGKLCVTAIEKEEHSCRAMVDGQIEDIGEVARVAASVKRKLEEKVGFKLERVHVAAAGRALRTQRASASIELETVQTVTEDIIRTLENGAIREAEEAFGKEEAPPSGKQFYLVGYSVCQYYLDNYPISSLLDHKGKNLKADIIATFLPGEVVESLYTSMQKGGMEVASMTLEPIASMNASVPQKLRLLNLVLVDIGAGTSDIAAARDGSIAGYTMATTAGDEVTETLMKEYLTDFETAERLKMSIGGGEELEYSDVLGFEHTITPEEVQKIADPAVQNLCKQIAERILEVNGSAPSAVFLVGGGSKLVGVREYVAQYLGMDLNRVALGGNNFSIHAESDIYDLKDPEYSTPLGIAISAALNLINDSFYLRLNGQRAKLFRSGRLTVKDVLMMNGYGYRHMIGRSGQNLVIYVDGDRKVIHGGYAVPAQLTLNGQPAKISDLVKAGDEIYFEPAESGGNAVSYLREVVTLEEKGRVSWNGGEITLGTMAEVNGAPAEGDIELHNGDRIKTYQIYTAGELAEFCHIEGTVTVNGVAVPPEWELEPGDIIRDFTEEKPKGPLMKAESPPGIAAGETSAAAEPKTLEAVREAPAAPARPAAGQEPRRQRSVALRLNGKNLELPVKKDGAPYYLMDMLSHVDMDLSKPEGAIMLRINGGEAGFQTELRDRDVIDITWQKR